MKKNIFKKAGRVFTSLALAVSICLTMSVSVFAKNGNDLENKNINYRDYLYFVIDQRTSGLYFPIQRKCFKIKAGDIEKARP